MQIYRQPSLLPDSVGFEFLDCSYTQIVDSFSTAASFSFTNIGRMRTNQRIRIGRETKGLSVQAFADALGVTRAAVNQWEKEGGTAPSRKHQPAVAKLIGITVAELMAESGHTNSLPALVDTAQTAIKEVAPDILALIKLVNAIPLDARKDALMDAATVLIGYLVPVSETPTQAPIAAETQANTPAERQR